MLKILGFFSFYSEKWPKNEHRNWTKKGAHLNFQHPSVQLGSFQNGDERNWTDKRRKKEKSLRRKVFGLKKRRIGGVKDVEKFCMRRTMKMEKANI